VVLGEIVLGTLGELHPLWRHYELPPTPGGADLDLQALMQVIPSRYPLEPVPAYPPVLEDLAVIVDESIPAEQVEAVIRQAGGRTLSAVRLFDVYRGGQTGAGKKSLAYSLTYQSAERTLTDEDALKIRQRIVRQLEADLGAKLRS
jgi:phenylalanyl-tRNA synthetase beta chain